MTLRMMLIVVALVVLVTALVYCWKCFESRPSPPSNTLHDRVLDRLAFGIDQGLVLLIHLGVRHPSMWFTVQNVISLNMRLHRARMGGDPHRCLDDDELEVCREITLTFFMAVDYDPRSPHDILIAMLPRLREDGWHWWVPPAFLEAGQAPLPEEQPDVVH